MRRILLPLSAVIPACSPAPQEAFVQQPSPPPTMSSTSANPGSGIVADLPAEAIGRRAMSTAFVMIGPDRELTVGLRDGNSIVLRDVAMHAEKYCGVRMRDGVAGGEHCGSYADVVTARPGGKRHVPDTVGTEAQGVEARPADLR